jgi:glycosyltransferase involved in cell wall biosynthesis
MSDPVVSVIVPSRNRPLRLRWLLNAIEGQTADRSLWEVIVVYDERDSQLGRELEAHPLAAAGMLRAVGVRDGTIGAKRNAGWRAARGPSVAFTDEDCRPPETWLAGVIEAIRAGSSSLIEGPVHGDPDEAAMRHAPFWRMLDTREEPDLWPHPWNIVYPRAVIERMGGFPEDVAAGEDIELAGLLGWAAGDAAMLTFGAIDDQSLLPWLRAASDLRDLALVFKRHPELRQRLYLQAFWKRSHAWLPLALAGLLLQRRRPLAIGLVVPWAALWEPRHDGIRGRVRHLTELPGWALIDSAELLAMVRGSLRHRSIVL